MVAESDIGTFVLIVECIEGEKASTRDVAAGKGSITKGKRYRRTTFEIS